VGATGRRGDAKPCFIGPIPPFAHGLPLHGQAVVPKVERDSILLTLTALQRGLATRVPKADGEIASWAGKKRAVRYVEISRKLGAWL
jgi:hypothetical protein